jgi:hypothetical protein
MGITRPRQDDHDRAIQDNLSALVHLLALRAAEEFVASSLAERTKKERADAPSH